MSGIPDQGVNGVPDQDVNSVPDQGVWADVCDYADLLPDRGVAALVQGEQVAVFRLTGGELYAVGNFDPIGGAFVLSRGLVGSRGDRAVVFSPLYKQAYDLATGRCLDDPEAAVPTYPVQVRNGRVYVGAVTSASRDTTARTAEYENV